MADYKIAANGGVLHQPTKMLIYPHEQSSYWQDYLAWVAGGGVADPEYSQGDVLATILDEVDRKTNELIESGWIYPDTEGQPVRLNTTDQAHYEGEKNLYAELDYDGVDVLAFFPLTVKVWTGPSGEPVMLQVTDLAAYKTFIRAGKAHIRSKLDEGWALKNQLILLTLAELQAWSDVR